MTTPDRVIYDSAIEIREELRESNKILERIAESLEQIAAVLEEKTMETEGT